MCLLFTSSAGFLPSVWIVEKHNFCILMASMSQFTCLELPESEDSIRFTHFTGNQINEYKRKKQKNKAAFIVLLLRGTA